MVGNQHQSLQSDLQDTLKQLEDEVGEDYDRFSSEHQEEDHSELSTFDCPSRQLQPGNGLKAGFINSNYDGRGKSRWKAQWTRLRKWTRY